MGPVTTRIDNGVAIVTMDSPPVNALGAALRRGIHDALSAARADAAVTAVVLTGTPRAFSAGADITEFGKPPQEPSLFAVLDLLEAMDKPVVAAIAGLALGGGCELALACHARVATPKARLGLPEVKLGLIPGAGGTQRLPRLIGAVEALKIAASGDPVPAPRAEQLGLVDAIGEDVVATAASHARAMVGTTLPVASRRTDRLGDRAAFEAAAKTVLARVRGEPGPAEVVEAVRACFDQSFADALKTERALFTKLMQDDRSKALRYAFFAEREANRVPGIPAEVKKRSVERVAVIGAGTMGGGITMSFVNAGIPVTIIETDQGALDRGVGRIGKTYETSVGRGSLKAEDASKRQGLITGKVGLEAVAGADLIIEAVFEEMELKKTVFRALDQHAKPGAILGSNTSTLDIDAIAAQTKRPEDVIGLHFFSPANVMRLLEIVRGAKTAPDVIATSIDVARRIAKVPVVVGVCDGFVGNRMLARRGGQAERLLLEGALPHQVDAAITNFGFRMGPFAMGDLAGLDIGWRLRKAKGTKNAVADALCEAGRFGQKTGRGYYSYAEDPRKPAPDPEVEALITKASEEMQIRRRAIDEEEIFERLTFPMINEGARILEEGIATRAGDIDVIWLYGYNWPAWRGGPMWYADRRGLRHVADSLNRYADASGDESLRPSPLLAELAAKDATFAGYRRDA